jgi:hypothetical protein
MVVRQDMLRYRAGSRDTSSARTPISKGIKLARLTERKRIIRGNQRNDARPSKIIKSKSRAMLIVHIRNEHMAQVSLAKDDDMVKTFLPSAPAAARVLLSLIWGITTGCLSYAPKGKLPAGVCLIIIGTEGGVSHVNAQTC